MSNVTGSIFQIQRWSINDGEGIRSTVFFKGCPLRCQWCANPESWRRNPEVLFFQERCSGCGRCAQGCESGALRTYDQTIGFVRENCSGCGKCCAVCPTGARKIIGSVVTVEEVLQVIKRDAIFYRESGGGVTFSGGEPFAQAEFLRQLVMACNRLGLDTAVETSGYFEWNRVKDIFAYLDFVFVDIKLMDDTLHQRFTGVSNRVILENIAAIARVHPSVVVRVPLVEAVNAAEGNIRAMCEFLCQHPGVKGIEILPYHDFGESKYRAVGAAPPAFTTPDAAHTDGVKKTIAGYGIKIFDFS